MSQIHTIKYMKILKYVLSVYAKVTSLKDR